MRSVGRRESGGCNFKWDEYIIGTLKCLLKLFLDRKQICASLGTLSELFIWFSSRIILLGIQTPCWG